MRVVINPLVLVRRVVKKAPVLGWLELYCGDNKALVFERASKLFASIVLVMRQPSSDMNIKPFLIDVPNMAQLLVRKCDVLCALSTCSGAWWPGV